MLDRTAASAEALITVTDLSIAFRTERGLITAVDTVSFSIRPGELVSLVGESGSGKSLTSLAVMGLITDPNGVVTGSIRYKGREIVGMARQATGGARRRDRHDLPDPMSAMTPVYTIGWQIAEQLRAHRKLTRKQARTRAIELLGEMGMPSPAVQVDRYPHQLSGGIRQGAIIAMALSCAPSLLIADEPTTALDVSVQAQIVNLFMDLQDRLGITYIFIAHDLSVIRQVSRRTAVMYLGAVVETGPTDGIFAKPAHPYTAALISAVPVPEVDSAQRERIMLRGDVPSPLNPPSGCRFHTRCPKAQERCRTEAPLLRPMPGGQEAACHFPLV